MVSYSAIFQAILPVFLIMGVGFAMRRTGFITATGDEALMKLGINILYPCLILDNVLGRTHLMEGQIVGPAIGLGFLFVLAGTIAGYGLAPLFGLQPGSGRRTFAITTGIQNYGFLAIPVMQAVLPSEAFSDALGVLFLHSLGIELAIWTVGVMVLKGARAPQWRLLANGPVIAIVLGLVLNYSGGHAFVPGVADSVLHTLGLCAIPFGLLLVGASIADLLTRDFMRGAVPVISGGLLVRLILIPALMLTAAATLSIGGELQQVLIVQAAMPCAVFPILMARMYGGHPTTAVQLVLGTTAFSVFTIPLIITLAMRWMGQG